MRKQVLTGALLLLAAVSMLEGCERTSSAARVAPAAGIAASPQSAQSSASPSPAPSPDGQITEESGMPVEESLPAAAARRVSALKPLYAVGKGQVALTIDDGPTKDTGKLLKVLKEYDAPVTFFFLGQNVEKYHESVTQAVYEGHAVGYHSDKHPQMAKMSYEEQEEEFNSGLRKLEKWCKKPVVLFRPPYGSYNNDTKLITEDHKMSMVLWNEDPKDWAASDASQVTKSVLSQARSGSIIVMHDNPSTIAALPDIIKGLREKGYKLVTIP
jgi:peptidoglycan/xylan/chitin deacetylase (PgdA/CDA1 family)